MGGLTLGQIAKMVAASRGSNDPSAQNNGMSGISGGKKNVVGATRARTKFPGGLLLVDSGAVDTCFPEGTFDVPVDTSQRRDLYRVEGSLIRNNGRQHPVVKVGPEQVPVSMGGNETSVLEPVLAVAKILDNGRDVHFTRAGCYMEDDDGQRISFFRIQDRFWLPYTTAEPASSHNILAPIVGAPEAAPVGEENIQEKGKDEDWGFLERFDPEAEADPEIVLLDDDMPLEALLEVSSPAPQPNLPGVPVGPSEEEKALHNATHCGSAPWCTHCIA